MTALALLWLAVSFGAAALWCAAVLAVRAVRRRRARRPSRSWIGPAGLFHGDDGRFTPTRATRARPSHTE